MKAAIYILLFNLLTTSIFSLTIDGKYIKDSYGNKILLKKYDRVVSLSPATIETLYMIGGENCLVAIGKTMSPIWPAKKTTELKSVGSITKPSIEKIVEANADLVILNGMNSRTATILKERNINFIYYDGIRLMDILNNVKIIGIISGQEKKANELYNQKLKLYNRIKAEVKNKPLKIKGAFIYNLNPLMAFSNNTLPGDLMNLYGVENIVRKVKSRNAIIGTDYLLSVRPDFLVIIAKGKKPDLKKLDPMVKLTKAYKNGNIFILDSGKILRGSPRVFNILEDIYNNLKKAIK